MDWHKRYIISVGIIICVLLSNSCKKEITCHENGNIKSDISVAGVWGRKFNDKNSYISIYKKNDFSQKPLENIKLLGSSSSADYQRTWLDFEIRNNRYLDDNMLNNKYDYRIVLDDSIYFDISDIKLVNDTMGHGMTNWAIRCNIISYRVNDSLITEDLSDILILPYSQRKIRHQ